jgi:hypothetical protein
MLARSAEIRSLHGLHCGQAGVARRASFTATPRHDRPMHPDVKRHVLYQLRLWMKNDLVAPAAAAAASLVLALRAPSATSLRGSFTILARVLGKSAAGALGSLLATLMLFAGRYRTLADDEVRDARAVFGDALDVDAILVSRNGLVHRLIFDLQRRCTGCRRAFVTNNLVHLPAERPLPRHVFIHELTHVCQAMVDGPSYLCSAVRAQLWGEGYNYGYRDDRNSGVRVPIDHAGGTALISRGEALGEGAQAVLEGRPFESFNPEQQAQIVMHYFVRRVLLGQPEHRTRPWTRHVERMREALAQSPLRHAPERAASQVRR